MSISNACRRDAIITPQPSSTAAGPPSLPVTTNLYSWHRADLGVTLSGSNVSTWADQSGNSHDINAVGTGPTVNSANSTFGNKPTLHFASGAQRMSSSHAYDKFHVFVVSQITSVGYMFRSPSSGLQSYLSNAASAILIAGTSHRIDLGANWGLSASAPKTYEYLKNASAPTLAIYLNEVDQGGTPISSSGASSGAIYLMADDAGNNASVGDIAEIIVFSGEMLPADVTSVRAYLKARYAHY